MKTKLALLAIVTFTLAVGFTLNALGVGDNHSNIIWALVTSVAFLITLLVDVWMFFAIAGEEAYEWKM